MSQISKILQLLTNYQHVFYKVKNDFVTLNKYQGK